MTNEELRKNKDVDRNVFRPAIKRIHNDQSTSIRMSPIMTRNETHCTINGPPPGPPPPKCKG